MKPTDTDSLRWTERAVDDDSVEGLAGALLRKMPTPQDPTDDHLARLGARIAERSTAKKRDGAAAWGWRLGLATLAIASLFAVMWVKIGGRPLPGSTAPEVATATSGPPISIGPCGVVDVTQRLGERSSDGAVSMRRILLVGPGEARVIGGGGDWAKVHLHSGQLVARTDERKLIVDSEMARVVMGPGAIAEVRIHAFQLTVAAFQGDVALEWKAPPQHFDVASGLERSLAGLKAIDGARAREVDRLLATEAGSVAGNPVCRAADEGEPAARVAATAAPAVGAPAAEAAAPEAAAAEPARPRPAATRPRPSAATPRVTQVEPAPVAPAPAAAEATLAAESRLVSAALLRVRARDGLRALALLDEHEGRFAAGILKPEAQLLRIDALLLVGRRSDALAKLDALKLDETTRARELRVLRGELRAESNRCDAASHDFTAALAGSTGQLAERALFGRASCRSRQGDSPGARTDLEQYLERFPRGRFAPQAHRGLGR